MTAIKECETHDQCKSIAFFKSLPLFARLLDKEVGRFVDSAQIKHYKRGKFLYLEDTKADSFYVICRGWIKLSRTTKAGEEVNLAILTKFSTTGKHAIFENGRHTTTAQAVEDSEVLSIPLTLLNEQLRVDTQLALNMLGSMVQYQRRQEQQLEQYLLYSAPQRIGCFLLGLCPAAEQRDGIKLELPYDKTLIASVLGMKGATFSRALNILREETSITIIGSYVIVDSMERLLKFVNGCYSYPHPHAEYAE